MLHAALRGSTRCRWCGRTLRLDMLSRWMLSCMLALLLPNALFYGDVFYSGHLFLVSMFVIFAAWRLLSAAVFPFITLEATDHSPLDRTKSMVLMGVLLAAAMTFDGFMASRFESDDALESTRAPSAVYRER